YERVGGEDRLVLPPDELHLRSRAVPYRPRKAYTAILLDEEADEEPEAEPDFVRLPRAESKNEEALRLARAARHAIALPDHVQPVNIRLLPSTAEAYDGIDHFVVASGRLAHDTAGLLALRRWLQQGGKVWVMLDLV